MTDTLYSTREVCAALGIKRSRICQIVARAQPPIGRKIGFQRVFTEHDLARLRARRTTPGFPLPQHRKDSPNPD